MHIPIRHRVTLVILWSADELDVAFVEVGDHLFMPVSERRMEVKRGQLSLCRMRSSGLG